MKEFNVKAKVNNLNKVLSFVTCMLEEAGCSMKLQMQIEVAVEEIFVNIAHYAYTPGEGDATILAGIEDGTLTVVFKDQGIPFDPLKKEDPDVEAKAADRSIGGLGIYMVKKSMDDMRYERTDGYNILTLVKKI